MLSKIVLKLIQESIFPALLVVAVKLLGIVLTVTLLNISWQISYENSPLPQIVFSSTQEFVQVSSWSNFFTILAISLGLGWVLTKAYFLHDTHISPRLTLRLISLDLLDFLTTTVEVSYQGLIWLSYLWLLIAFSVLQAYLGHFYPWMLAVSLTLGAVLTWFFILDLEKETQSII